MKIEEYLAKFTEPADESAPGAEFVTLSAMYTHAVDHVDPDERRAPKSFKQRLEEAGVVLVLAVVNYRSTWVVFNRQWKTDGGKNE